MVQQIIPFMYIDTKKSINKSPPKSECNMVLFYDDYMLYKNYKERSWDTSQV